MAYRVPCRLVRPYVLALVHRQDGLEEAMSGSLDTVEVRRLLEEQIQRRAKALEDFTDATNKVAALASLLHAEGEQMPDGIVIAT